MTRRAPVVAARAANIVDEHLALARILATYIRATPFAALLETASDDDRPMLELLTRTQAEFATIDVARDGDDAHVVGRIG